MKAIRFKKSFFALGCSVLIFFACSKSERRTNGEDSDSKPALPVVTDERDDLLLSWFADGGAKTANRVANVPEEARREVRVQDPAIPPEKRNPQWIFLADLTASPKSSGYPVRALKRSVYEKQRKKVRRKEQEASAPDAVAATNGAPVIMYATKHCPVCKTARRWLLEQKIPYIEKDIEKDATAAADLQRKGREQGIATNGVPVFEINGKLLPGFDPGAINKLLGARSVQQMSI